MISNRHLCRLSIAALLIFAFTCTQKTPNNPYDPSNTRINIIVKSSSGQITTTTLTDTIYSTVQYGININLPSNVDSIQIKTFSMSDSISTFLPTLKDFNQVNYNDTVWKTLTFTDTGTISVIGTAFVRGGSTLSASVMIAVLSRPTNHQPTLVVTGRPAILPAQSCTLIVSATDPDAFQTLTYSKLQGPSGSAFDPQSRIFIWTSPDNFIGVDSVIFKVEDNGYPSLSDTKKVYINVTATITNIPPDLVVSGVRNIRTGDTCTLKVKAVTDAAQQSFISMLWGPGGSSLKDSIFTWVPPTGYTGRDSARFMAVTLGSAPLSDSQTVYINVSQTISAPSRPDSLKIVRIKDGKLTLAWHGSLTADNYTVFRADAGQGRPFAAIDTVFDYIFIDSIGSSVYSYYVKAFNTAGASPSSDTVRAVVPNRPPKWQSDTINQSTQIGTKLSLMLTDKCSDPDGDTLRFVLLPGKPDKDTITGAVYSFTPTIADTGTWRPRIVVGDVAGLMDTVTLSIAVSLTQANRPPKWSKDTLPLSGAAGDSLTMKFSDKCTDPDGDSLTFLLLPGNPGKDTVRSGIYSFKSALSDTGISWLHIVAKDPKGLTDTMTIKLTITGNHKPVLTVTGVRTVKSGDTCRLIISAIDLDSAQKLTYSLIRKPTGSSLDSGVFKWITPMTFKGIDTAIFKVVDNGVPPLFDSMLVQITVTDSAVPKTYSVIYNGNGSTSGSVPVDSTHYKTSAKITVLGNTGTLARTGYGFAGWNTKIDGSGTSYAPADTFTMGSSNDTLFAKWTQKVTFALTISATNGSVTKTPDFPTYDSGTVVKLTPVPANNYHFTGWSGSMTGTNNPDSVIMNSAKTVTAVFAVNPPNKFALTVLATNGTVKKTPDLAQYDSGSTVGLKATASPGYSFVNWSGDATGTSDSIAVILNSAKSVTANFALKKFALTIVAANGSVTKTPDAAQYDSGTVVSLNATASPGYLFNNWTGAVTGTTTPATITMTGAKSVTANFSIKKFALTISAVNGSVTKTPDATQYDSGAVVSLAATPSTGYQFSGWTGDLTGTTTPASITMTGAKNVTASFTLNTFQLTVLANSNGTITAPATIPATVNYNALTTITAVPNSGYVFGGWTVTAGTPTIGSAASASTTAKLTAGDATITASFSQNRPAASATPSSRSVCAGSANPTFNASANGGSAPYTWYWSNGSSTQTMTVNISGLSGTSSYYCIVTDQYGMKDTTNTVSLTVNPRPTLTGQPIDMSICQGNTGFLNVQVPSGANYSYQWYKQDGTLESGATSMLIWPNPSSTTTYYCIITDPTSGCSVQSSSGTITVRAMPSITTQPTNMSIHSGETGFLSCGTPDGSGYTFQWWNNNTGSPAEGINGSTYAILWPQPTSTTTYYCNVTDPVTGCTVNTMTATITVLP